jgi:hypothetical protein
MNMRAQIGFVMSLAVGAATANAQPLFQNLLVNPGFETGNTNGWSGDSIPLVSPSTAGGVGLPNINVLGNWVVWPGRIADPDVTMFQEVSITTLAADVDSGLVGFNYKALVQSRRSGGFVDTGTTLFEQLDANATVVASRRFTGTAFDGQTNWTIVDDVGLVVPGARALRVTLIATRNGGESTDCFFDNIEITLIPAPSAAAVLGLGGLLAARRRR